MKITCKNCGKLIIETKDQKLLDHYLGEKRDGIILCRDCGFNHFPEIYEKFK